MTRRERHLTMVLQVVTMVVVIGLLIYSIVMSQNFARDRAEAALRASKQNGQVLEGIESILRDVRGAQVNQREAFRALARRNERLHGRDPEQAPRFDPLPTPADDGGTSPTSEPQASKASGGEGSQRQGEPTPRQSPAPAPRQSPRPSPSPTPSPTPPPPPRDQVCVPLVDVCVDQPGANR